MVRLNRIYTRTGDKGSTRLVGGQEVDKDSARIEAYGTVDELNAVLGMLRAQVRGMDPSPEMQRLDGWLRVVQNDLFDLGSDLATRIEDRWENQPLVEEADVTALEHVIDDLNESLDPLKSFVLPGGGPLSSTLHLARTVCRRAERRILTLARQEAVGEQVVPYVNRLSDALFVWSRWVAKHAGEEELLWDTPSARGGEE